MKIEKISQSSGVLAAPYELEAAASQIEAAVRSLDKIARADALRAGRLFDDGREKAVAAADLLREAAKHLKHNSGWPLR